MNSDFVNIKTLDDLVNHLCITKAELFDLLSEIKKKQAYVSFRIRKKSGGYRNIDSPKNDLKLVQIKLNKLFQLVYGERKAVHGFVLNRSIITNAKPHLSKRIVLNIDIKNFFPSINFGRCYGLLVKSPYELSKEIASIIAQLICYRNTLPQGAPTSPIVSNMICAKLDSRLSRYLSRKQIEYTRYADDLTFSTDLDWIDEPIIAKIKSIIVEEGFEINNKKFRIQRKLSKQEVTGITVNEKLNVSRYYIRNIRALLHSWETEGISKASEKFDRVMKKNKIKSKNYFKESLLSRIEYIGQVRGRNDDIYLNFWARYRKLDQRV